MQTIFCVFSCVHKYRKKNKQTYNFEYESDLSSLKAVVAAEIVSLFGAWFTKNQASNY